MKTHISLKEKLVRDNVIYRLTVASRGHHPCGPLRKGEVVRLHDKTEYVVMPNGSLRRTTLRPCEARIPDSLYVHHNHAVRRREAKRNRSTHA